MYRIPSYQIRFNGFSSFRRPPRSVAVLQWDVPIGRFHTELPSRPGHHQPLQIAARHKDDKEGRAGAADFLQHRSDSSLRKSYGFWTESLSGMIITMCLCAWNRTWYRSFSYRILGVESKVVDVKEPSYNFYNFPTKYCTKYSKSAISQNRFRMHGWHFSCKCGFWSSSVPVSSVRTPIEIKHFSVYEFINSFYFSSFCTRTA